MLRTLPPTLHTPPPHLPPRTPLAAGSCRRRATSKSAPRPTRSTLSRSAPTPTTLSPQRPSPPTWPPCAYGFRSHGAPCVTPTPATIPHVPPVFPLRPPAPPGRPRLRKAPPASLLLPYLAWAAEAVCVCTRLRQYTPWHCLPLPLLASALDGESRGASCTRHCHPWFNERIGRKKGGQTRRHIRQHKQFRQLAETSCASRQTAGSCALGLLAGRARLPAAGGGLPLGALGLLGLDHAGRLGAVVVLLLAVGVARLRVLGILDRLADFEVGRGCRSLAALGQRLR